MKKHIIPFLSFIIVTSLLLGLNSVVLAAQPGAAAEEGASASTGTDPTAELGRIIGGPQKSGLTDWTSRFHKLSSVDPGADVLTSVIFTTIDFFKYLIGGIAVIYVIISGIKLITSGNKIDEVSEKEKENIKFIIYGLILIIIADELVTKVFFGEYGECIASESNAAECAKVGGSLIKGIYSFILSLIATIAIFVIVLSAFRLITSYGTEETITKQKKRIMVSVIGILIAAFGEFIVKGIVFPESGTKQIDVVAAQKLVFNFTNFVAAFIGAGAFVMLFYGGYLYVVSAGNEEQTGKAKKIIINAVIGIIIALAAFGIVTTITAFSPSRELNLPQSLPGLPGGGS